MEAGFHATGIYPFDKKKYPEKHFKPEALKRYFEHQEKSRYLSEQELMEPRPSTSSVKNLSEPELMESRPSTSGVNSSAASFEDLLLNRIGKTSTPNIK